MTPATAEVSAELARTLTGPSIFDLPHGLHEGITEDAYHRRDKRLASKHGLDLLLKSAATFRAWANGADDEPTPAMVAGKDFHTACLEPSLYKPSGLTTAKGRQTAEMIAGMVASVHAHPVAGPMLKHSKRETTARWRDPATGVECKARADLWSRGLRMLGDLKSCADASPEEFAKACARYTYHLQAAFYLDGFVRAGADVDTFAFIAVEKTPPHLCAVYMLDGPALFMGERRARRGLERLARCLETDVWPGLSNHIETLSLPRWVDE